MKMNVTSNSKSVTYVLSQRCYRCPDWAWLFEFCTLQSQLCIQETGVRHCHSNKINPPKTGGKTVRNRLLTLKPALFRRDRIGIAEPGLLQNLDQRGIAFGEEFGEDA